MCVYGVEYVSKWNDALSLNQSSNDNNNNNNNDSLHRNFHCCSSTATWRWLLSKLLFGLAEITENMLQFALKGMHTVGAGTFIVLLITHLFFSVWHRNMFYYDITEMWTAGSQHRAAQHFGCVAVCECATRNTENDLVRTLMSWAISYTHARIEYSPSLLRFLILFRYSRNETNFVNSCYEAPTLFSIRNTWSQLSIWIRLEWFNFVRTKSIRSGSGCI